MAPGPPFILFGAGHLAVLALVAAVSAGLAARVRRRPASAGAVRAGLAALLVAATLAYLVAVVRTGRLDVWDVVPLHLCDFLILVAVFALLTRNRAATELLYFWAGTGTLLAMVTPDLGAGFPDWRFVLYFVLHGGVVAAAVVLVFGQGLRPRPGAAGRSFLLTNAYAAIVYGVDVAFDRNFLYLRHKPYAPTLLDWMGPWPVYILVVEAVALVLFAGLELPFLWRRLRASEASR